MSPLPGEGVQSSDLRFWKTQQDLRCHPAPEDSDAQAAGQEGVQAGDHVDGPQGEPVSGPAEATTPDSRPHPGDLGIRKGFLCQRGETGPWHSLCQLLCSP